MAATHEIPVVWLQAATCTGCSVSILNSSAPKITDLVLSEVIPGRHINLRFQATVMAGAGEPVVEIIERIPKEEPGAYVLIVEGSIPRT
ncbi:oxidoreductase, partial [Candidatus Bipolaricaulota bacterium]